jgi:hypothetical protein
MSCLRVSKPNLALVACALLQHETVIGERRGFAYVKKTTVSIGAIKVGRRFSPCWASLCVASHYWSHATCISPFCGLASSSTANTWVLIERRNRSMENWEAMPKFLVCDWQNFAAQLGRHWSSKI